MKNGPSSVLGNSSHFGRIRCESEVQNTGRMPPQVKRAAQLLELTGFGVIHIPYFHIGNKAYGEKASILIASYHDRPMEETITFRNIIKVTSENKILFK